ncbi:hypothetical protein EVAR_22717_1 [Eumeta japonica]|uniref:Uncharacterized protein n=1 Tax=Eumeta variegata TaxID=151549 RepID=A0A4C1USB7_EUMVA|nr:hypothetical protein EVAR_22717_1 [Eumeta japonica]
MIQYSMRIIKARPRGHGCWAPAPGDTPRTIRCSILIAYPNLYVRSASFHCRDMLFRSLVFQIRGLGPNFCGFIQIVRKSNDINVACPVKPINFLVARPRYRLIREYGSSAAAVVHYYTGASANHAANRRTDEPLRYLQADSRNEPVDTLIVGGRGAFAGTTRVPYEI